jgi:hypothetical protein
VKNNWGGECWGIYTPGNYPEESTQQSEQVERLKLRNLNILIYMKMEKHA